MKTINLGSWVVEYDSERTREFYKPYHYITDSCACLYCKNYLKTIENALPKSVMQIFDTFGIDPRKEGEVSQYYEDDDGLHLYGGFYHIVGRLVEGPDCWVKSEDNLEQLTNELYEIDGFTFGFTYGLSLLPENFPMPALQLEFQGKLPWVISEKW